MKHREYRRRNIKIVTLMLAAITTVVWLVLLIIKYLVSGIELEMLFDDVIANILGILPPIIIFNFAYEYLTKDYISDEISDSIIKTLMCNPETLNAFDDNAKRKFAKSVVSSIVGSDKSDSVYSVIEPYLVHDYDTRSSFDYNIEVSLPDCNNKWCDVLSNTDNYYFIEESFVTKKTFSKNFSDKKVRVGFFTQAESLDYELKNDKFLFRENLQLSPNDMRELSFYTTDEKINVVRNLMKLKLFINNHFIEPVSVEITFLDIIVEFDISDIDIADNMSFEIRFSIPCLKRKSQFMISISEPTYSPLINFKYDEELMNVRTYTFINNDNSILRNATKMPGNIRINPQEWVYPQNGIVFVVDELYDKDGRTTHDNLPVLLNV